jgi:hypothetical protein
VTPVSGMVPQAAVLLVDVPFVALDVLLLNGPTELERLETELDAPVGLKEELEVTVALFFPDEEPDGLLEDKLNVVVLVLKPNEVVLV